jgi:asparagine synthase (glutamine-hydrolysing)
MSGVYGVLQFNGAPVDQAVLSAMHAVYAQWFNDHHGTWLVQGVGLGHTQRWNTPESRLEKLPEVEGPPGDRLVITADARLDNRSELIAALGLTAPPATITDT